MIQLAFLLLALFDWYPPSRQMPVMPAPAELEGEWRGSLGSWFVRLGVDLSEIRAQAEGGRERSRLVRFVAGGRPVAQWSDRNGDGRADLVETFRNGALIAQLGDADYDGAANWLRAYDASGALAREQRY